VRKGWIHGDNLGLLIGDRGVNGASGISSASGVGICP
jgi:hypothetical protein